MKSNVSDRTRIYSLLNSQVVMTRDERQELSIKRWKESKGKGTIEACTAYGKTFLTLKIISKLVAKKSDLSILIVVPTTTLKEQWEDHLKKLENTNSNVVVINSAIRTNHKCDLLVLDEEHRFASDTFQTIFTCVDYKFILGLTATIERLDGKHAIINKYCPVCDTVTLLEAQANGWVSPYKEYLVLLDVDDIEEYININTEFNKYFEFFNYDFNTVMSCTGPNGWKYQIWLRNQWCPNGTKKEKDDLLKKIKIYSIQFSRLMQARKKFINHHPKKLEVARRIIEARPNSKIITFSNSIEMAEKIGIGKVYSGRDSKKQSRATIAEIRNGDIRVLNTVKKAIEGLSVDDISIAIRLGIDSSKTKSIQSTGRVIRFIPGKEAEIFTLVINNTVETKWFQNSHGNLEYITVDEEGLNKVLEGGDYKPYKKKIQPFMFRY